LDLPRLEFRRLSPEWKVSLEGFFVALRAAGDEKHFHPHALTAAEARQRSQYAGRDLYYVMVEGERVLGYGMLRGWDEGYPVPSLGIALHPSARGLGLGKAFMYFLHAAARRRGARQVRLKVYPANRAAIRLYEGLGYRFQTEEGGQLVGIVDL